LEKLKEINRFSLLWDEGGGQTAGTANHKKTRPGGGTSAIPRKKKKGKRRKVHWKNTYEEEADGTFVEGRSAENKSMSTGASLPRSSRRRHEERDKREKGSNDEGSYLSSLQNWVGLGRRGSWKSVGDPCFKDRLKFAKTEDKRRLSILN